MKTGICIIVTILLMGLVFCICPANAVLFENTPYHYRIDVHPSWTETPRKFPDHAGVTYQSPDSDAMVGIRTFKATPKTDIEFLKTLFTTDIFSSPGPEYCERSVLNAAEGQKCFYKGSINGRSMAADVFFAIKYRQAYMLWRIFSPETPFYILNESDKIFNSFTISEEGRHIYDEPVRIVEADVGDRLINGFRLASAKNRFSSTAKTIHLVFRWTGNTFGAPFLIRWISINHNYIVKEIALSTPDADGGRLKSTLVTQYRGWPTGDYGCEIWFQTMKLETVHFSILQE